MNIDELCVEMSCATLDNSTDFINKVRECLHQSADEFTHNPSNKTINFQFELTNFIEEDFEDAVYNVVDTYNNYAYVDFVESNHCCIEWHPIYCNIRFAKLGDKFVFYVSCVLFDEVPDTY